MKTELHGYWVDISFCNADFSDSTRRFRNDMVCLDIKSKGIYGEENSIFDIRLYPEDLENLLLAIPPVLRESLKLRQKFDSHKTLQKGEITRVTIEPPGDDVYNIIRENLLKDYREKFKKGEWFEIPRNSEGVADTWGQEDLFEEFIPFLAWDSDSSEALLVNTKSWRDTLYHGISWCSRYTHLRGITSPV